MQPDELFIAGRLVACAKAPYLRAAIIGLTPFATEAVPTWAVTSSMVLLWNPTWTATLTVPKVAGLFLHEVAHVFGKHHDRVQTRNPKRFNIACDISINEMVRKIQGVALPEGGCFAADFDIKNPEATPEEIYELIPEPKLRTGGWGDACGSGAGNPIDAEALAPAGLGRTPVEVARIEKAVAEAIKNAQPGSVPRQLSIQADAALGPPKVPWEATLARIVRGSAGLRAGAVLSTFSAPSRRQGGVGYGAGRPMFAALRAPVPLVSLALDTSGSMMGHEMEVAIREVDGLFRTLNADVDYAACDCNITVEKRIRSAREMQKYIRGGGGTDFRPFFDRIARRPRKPDVLVVMTDGYGPAPKDAPGYTVVWLLIGKHVGTPAKWGKILRAE